MLEVICLVQKTKSHTGICFYSFILNSNEFRDYCHLVAQIVAPACNAGDPSLIPGLGRSPGGRNGNPHQYSCLENFMEEGPDRLQSMGLQSQT